MTDQDTYLKDAVRIAEKLAESEQRFSVDKNRHHIQGNKNGLTY